MFIGCSACSNITACQPRISDTTLRLVPLFLKFFLAASLIGFS